VRGGLYDVAVDLQGAMRSAVLARWAGARVVLWRGGAARIPGPACGTRGKLPRAGGMWSNRICRFAEALVERPMGFLVADNSG